MLRQLLCVFLAVPATLVVIHTIVRMIRHFRKLPIPRVLVDLIDNPLRRRFQPPYETALRHGLEPGMTVLEVGPGNGTYTLGAARRVSEHGKVVTVDIEPVLVERVRRRAEAEGIVNIEARVADVYDLPLDDGVFDVVYRIAVIGEIPEPVRAMQEFHRVLSPAGIMVFSELFLDPDYPLASSVTRMAASAGFRLRQKIGGIFYYTLQFEKDL